MASLIADLGDDDTGRRDIAVSAIQERWMAWSEQELAALERAAEDEDPESAVRASRALATVQRRRGVAEILKPDGTRVLDEAIRGNHVTRTVLFEATLRSWTRGKLGDAEFEQVCALMRAEDWVLIEARVVDLCVAANAAPAGPILEGCALRREALGWNADDLLEVIGMVRATSSIGFVTDRMLSGPDWSSRPYLAAGLLRLQDKPELMTRLLREGPGQTAELVLSLIQATGAPGMADEVDRLAADGPIERRIAAIRALRVVSPARCRARILQAIGEPSIAAAACWRYADMDMPGESDRLVRLVRHEDPDIRFAAIRLLGPIASEAAEQALSSRLSDPDDGLWAVLALSRHATPGRIRAVMGAAAPEAAATRRVALLSFGKMAAIEGRGLVREALTSEGADLREAAASALGFMGEPEDVPRLAALIPAAAAVDKASPEEIQVACAAVIALGQIGGERARAAILRCLEEAALSDALTRAAIRAYALAADAGDFEPLNRLANRSMISNDLFLAIGRMGGLPLVREVAGTTPPRKADAWAQFIDSSEYLTGILMAGAPWVPADHEGLQRALARLRLHKDLRARHRAEIGLIAIGQATRDQQLETLRDLRVIRIYSDYKGLATPLCEALARRYEPEALSAYIAEHVVEEDITTVAAFAAWARKAGLVVEGLPHAFPGRLVAGRRLSVRSAMFRFEGTVVLTGNNVRLMADEDALAAWEPRLRAK